MDTAIRCGSSIFYPTGLLGHGGFWCDMTDRGSSGCRGRVSLPGKRGECGGPPPRGCSALPQDTSHTAGGRQYTGHEFFFRPCRIFCCCRDGVHNGCTALSSASDVPRNRDHRRADRSRDSGRAAWAFLAWGHLLGALKKATHGIDP